MGFMNKIKGWLNIGGPKVSIVEVEQPITGKSGVIQGRAKVTSKREAKLKKYTLKFIVEETKGKGEDKETNSTVIAEHTVPVDVTIPADGTHEIDIAILYDGEGLADRLAQKGGLLGAVGKASKFAGKFGEKGIKDYYVVVEVDVVGTALDPSDKMPVRATLED
jgi:hypothetical protein